MHYKIHIQNSNYHEYTWYNEETMVEIKNKETMINPLEHKLFSGDVINISNEIVYSPIRNDNNIPGILLLVGKTYGRSKNNKFYYKCIPNDNRIPAFLIPYELKNTGFNKNIINRFILFKYIEWKDKHPVGIIINMIGEINNLGCFYEYQLYCKNLFIPIKKFTSDVDKVMKKEGNNPFIKIIMEKYTNIENRLDHNVFTIDPKLSRDLDDGFSIKDNVLSIYIANVPILMEYFGLWNSFSERISTIYLPDRKRPMLPTLLSENLCSLLENESRFAFCMDIEVKDDEIIDIKFSNTLIKVRKNYDYDEYNELKKNNDYLKIFDTTKLLCKKYKYINNIKDSHDLVAFLMILMNNEAAKKMYTFKDGIYRTVKIKEFNNNKLPDEVFNFIKIWQSSSGQYATYENKGSHDLIASGIENYIHITSPIRRLVDLLNIIKLQDLLGLIKMSSLSMEFYNKWICRLEYINTTMRAIRKVQNDCNLLTLCVNTTNIMDEIYDGYIFDKIERENKYLQYTVYIPKIKIISRINIKNNLDEYTCLKFKLYLIEDGITLKRKIRVEIQTNII
uniref:RNB domain-containing protein n=1 Tax=viral metagenome TaxID=1070528 RepID=A0A6C0AZN9_9ZZZZ|tara:strand:- start:9855 stop:11543 length:1689 start_codon:yes stop_codon:yes gene_type:complete